MNPEEGERILFSALPGSVWPGSVGLLCVRFEKHTTGFESHICWSTVLTHATEHLTSGELDICELGVFRSHYFLLMLIFNTL